MQARAMDNRVHHNIGQIAGRWDKMAMSLSEKTKLHLTYWRFKTLFFVMAPNQMIEGI